VNHVDLTGKNIEKILSHCYNSDGDIGVLRFKYADSTTQKIFDYKMRGQKDQERDICRGHSIIGIYGLLTHNSIYKLGFITAYL